VTQGARNMQPRNTPHAAAPGPQAYASHTPHPSAGRPSQAHAHAHAQVTSRPQQMAPNGNVMSRPAAPPNTASTRPASVSPTNSGDTRSKSLDERSMKAMSMASLGFMVFFAILAATVLLNQRATHAQAEQTATYEQASILANAAAQNLDTKLAWIDQALATRGNAKQIVNLVARGTGVQGALVVSADNKLLASTPNTASAAPSIPVQDFPKTGVKIISLISDSGAVSPVIIRRIDNPAAR